MSRAEPATECGVRTDRKRLAETRHRFDGSFQMGEGEVSIAPNQAGGAMSQQGPNQTVSRSPSRPHSSEHTAHDRPSCGTESAYPERCDPGDAGLQPVQSLEFTQQDWIGSSPQIVR